MKILITDDHKIVREGLMEILKRLPDITEIDEAKDGNEAILKVASGSYDIILLDISLPDISGIEVLQTIIKKLPSTKILMLSMHPQEQYAIRAMKTGASGYLTKDTASEELITAIKRINDGGRYITTSLAESIADSFGEDYSKLLHEKLSEREFQILLKIAEGKPLNEIGRELFISAKTVSTYRSRIMQKMGMKNNSEITHYCLKNGLVE